jgi:predicted peptidase
MKIVKDSYKIVPEKVYLTGVSMGGHGTWYIGSRHYSLFAAIAPVCGFGKGEFGTPVIELNSLSELPVYAFHGQTDTIVPASCSRIIVQQMKERECDVSYNELQDVGHDCWDYVYRDDFLVEWLLGHSKAHRL